MGGKSGGTTTQVIQPTPTPQPSTADAMREYVNSLPALYEAQLKYAPLEAQQQVDLANQYAVPLAQAYQQAQEALYPGTSALQEQLVSQANQGMNAELPKSMRDQYVSDFNAQLGANAGSPIGADYVSRNLLNQQFEYQNYYRNLGLSLANRQPLVNPTTPNYTNQLGSYNPGQALGFIGGNYGSYLNAARPITTQNQGGTPNWALGLNAAGNVMQGVGQMGGLAGFMCWVAAELFGGWNKPDTVNARYYINTIAPNWFRILYMKYGFKTSQFIRKNKIARSIIKPFFKYFSIKGKEHAKSI